MTKHEEKDQFDSEKKTPEWPCMPYFSMAFPIIQRQVPVLDPTFLRDTRFNLSRDQTFFCNYRGKEIQYLYDL